MKKEKLLKMGFDNSFDGLVYTREGLIKQFLLLETHSTDGSAFRENCKCIQERHSFLIEGFADEGQVIAKEAKEKEFYRKVSQWAKEVRKKAVAMLEKGDSEAKQLYACLADEARKLRLAIEHEEFVFPVETVGCNLCVSCSEKTEKLLID